MKGGWGTNDAEVAGAVEDGGLDCGGHDVWRLGGGGVGDGGWVGGWVMGVCTREGLLSRSAVHRDDVG